MGGKKGKKKSKTKTKTKAQKMAVANKAKYGGTAKAAAANKKSMQNKAKSYTKTSGAATAAAKNKAAMKAKTKAKFTASQAAKKAVSTAKKSAGSISKGTAGIGPVKSGKTYAKAVSTAKNQPTKKTSGVGPVASGKQYASMLKASPPKFKDGTKVAGVTGYGLRPDGVTGEYKEGDVFNTGGKSGVDYKYEGVPGKGAFVPVKTAMLPGEGMGLGSVIGTGAAIGAGMSLPGMIKNAIDAGGKLKENIEKRVNPDADKISFAGDLGGLGIGTGAPSYFSIKSPESFGAPSQEAVDKAAGITAGGLNIGGSGFTPDKPSGGSTSRAISDRPASSFSFGPTADGNEYAKNLSEFGMRFGATPEARGKAYDQNPDLTSFKGLSDGTTFGSGPVASGDAYVRGLNTQPFGSVENTMRSIVGKIPLVNRIPGVNTRLLTDKEIADKRVKAAAFRQANLVGRRRGSGGGARLPVAPLTPEEILLPEQVAVQQTGPAYQQIEGQTGVDPNRLLQIQQEAYQQAFNPYNPLTVGGFNPFFRFFDRRRGARRGAFRRAFRRD